MQTACARIILTEAVTQRCSVKKSALRNFAKGKHLCLRPVTLLKKKNLAQVFSCEFCGILRTPFPKVHLRWLHLHFDLKRTKSYMKCFVLPLSSNSITFSLFFIRIFKFVSAIFDISSKGSPLGYNEGFRRF